MLQLKQQQNTNNSHPLNVENPQKQLHIVCHLIQSIWHPDGNFRGFTKLKSIIKLKQNTKPAKDMRANATLANCLEIVFSPPEN